MRLYQREFKGLNGQGAISVPDVKVGHIVLVVLAKNTGGDRTQYFERIITMEEQLKQTSNSDQSLIEWLAVLIDPTSTVGQPH